MKLPDIDWLHPMALGMYFVVIYAVWQWWTS